MPVNHLTLGPVRFVMRGADDRPVRYDDWAYRGFFTNRQAAAGRPRIELPVHIVRGSLPCPAGPPLFESGRNWAVWPERDGWFFGSGYVNRETPYRVCRVARGLDAATLYVDGDPGDAPLRYPLDQVLSWGLLGKCGGVLLHAAAVVRDGVGLVLAGRSGAGKSTLSGLCADAGWTILNDDRVMLYPDPAGAGWLAAGTPWPGSGHYALPATVPLQGIFLLTQDIDNRVERIAGGDARLALLPVASVAWFLDDWSQATLDALNRLTREAPVHRFCFTRSPEAVAALALDAVA